MVTYNDIRAMFDDYYWMIREVIRVRTELENGGWIKRGVASYREGSRSNQISDPVFRDVSVRDKQFKNLEKLENKLAAFNELLEKVSLTDREDCVINCLLDGMTMRETSKHTLVSPKTVSRILENVINRMLEAVSKE